MNVSQYVILFVFVAIMGAGLPGPGDASLIAAGTLAGDGTLKLGIVLATAMVAWMLGSVIGYAIGIHGGRRLLDHPGRLEKTRRKLLAKGDRVFGRHNFTASVTMPAFVSGIFRVRVVGIRAGSAGRWCRLDRDVRRDLVLPGRGGREAHRERRHQGRSSA